jgi:hypothetical protein
MKLPSGVHAGSSAVAFRSLNTARGFDPSAFMTYKLYWPRRSLMKAMDFPSGEMRGWRLSATPLVCVRTVAVPPLDGIL